MVFFVLFPCVFTDVLFFIFFSILGFPYCFFLHRVLYWSLSFVGFFQRLFILFFFFFLPRPGAPPLGHGALHRRTHPRLGEAPRPAAGAFWPGKKRGETEEGF